MDSELHQFLQKTHSTNAISFVNGVLLVRLATLLLLMIISVLLHSLMETRVVDRGNLFDLLHGLARIRELRVLLLDSLCNSLDQFRRLRIQGLQGSLQISDETIREAAAEILAHHDSQERDFLCIRCHGVGWHCPAVATQPVCNVILIEPVLVLQAEGNQRDTFRLGQEVEPPGLYNSVSQHLGIRRAVVNDLPVALPHRVHEHCERSTSISTDYIRRIKLSLLDLT